MSSESGKTVPIETQVGQASQRVTRLQREFSQAVKARQNAERLLADTKEEAIRIAGASCAERVAHTDSKDRASRIDLAQLLEPDAACRVVIDDIGAIGDADELGLSEEERAAYQANKKKFAEDRLLLFRASAAHSSLRRNVQKLGNHKSSGLRSEGWKSLKSDQESTGRWTSRTSATWAAKGRSRSCWPFKKGTHWPPTSKRKLVADTTTKTVPTALRTVFVGNHVVGYVETHASPAASQEVLRDFDRAGSEPVLSPAWPKTGDTSGRVTWGCPERYDVSRYRQLARYDSQCLGADRALDADQVTGYIDFSILSHSAST